MRNYILTAVILFILTISACSNPKYNKNDFLGKTSAEIVEEYGPFDCTLMPISKDGLYRNCRCGYTVKEPKVGFLGKSPEELFFIIFDENGVAYDCEINFRPGG